VARPTFNVGQILDCVGVAILSSQALAGIVKAWLQSRRTKVVISDPGSPAQIVYEDPNLKDGLREIVQSIEQLRAQAGSNKLTISARLLEPRGGERPGKENATRPTKSWRRA